MFRNALAVATQFTLPVVTSRRTVAGVCSSSIGAFVVVNPEGWILTAAHVLIQLDKLTSESAIAKKHIADEAAIRANAALNPKERAKQLQALGKLRKDTTEHYSSWWGFLADSISDIHVIEEVDIGVAKLANFDASKIKAYPVFKDPSKGIVQGVGLCKLGFPFHEIIPLWDGAAGAFSFPPGAIPLPSFPMDGIITRFITVQPVGAPPPFQLMQIETSTPGLMGQSGGPTIDHQGAVWAIQSNTAHLSLGFKLPAGKPEQFLNVGRGVHVETLLGFLDSLGVKYDKSPY